MTATDFLEDLPPSVLLRCITFIDQGIASARPEVRGPLMRAKAGDSGVMTIRAHKVGAGAFLCVTANLDDGTDTTMEIPGHLVGVFVDEDGDLVVVD
jgi:hypothetical protein